MKRKELFITLRFSVGEAPDMRELKNAGITLQDYAEAQLEDISLPGLSQFEVEVKATIKAVE